MPGHVPVVVHRAWIACVGCMGWWRCKVAWGVCLARVFRFVVSLLCQTRFARKFVPISVEFVLMLWGWIEWFFMSRPVGAYHLCVTYALCNQAVVTG